MLGGEMGQGRTSVVHNNINFEIFYHKTRLIVLIESPSPVRKINSKLTADSALNEIVYAHHVSGESDLDRPKHFMHVN